MENSELINQVLDDLLQKTREKKITWSSVNPNTFRWVRKEGTQVTTVILQKQNVVSTSTRVVQEDYIFTIQQEPPPKVVVQINTIANKQVREVLAKIFFEARNEELRRTNEKQAEIIKNLLKGL
jgi:hypothetical protein